MDKLTKQEEQLMQLFWKLEKALVRDVLNLLPEPRPPYTTLASNIKTLEKKGFLNHKSYGNIHEYFPIISQEAYRNSSFNLLVKDYFEGSISNVLSFLVKEKGLSEKDIADLQKIIDQENPDKP
jgi:BlaI family transcriptional regulator, penicillinase repressor